MKKFTKIVATISDRKCEHEFLQQLFEEGVNVVRLNTAHQGREEALKVVKAVRKVSDKIAILLDTKGPEVRTKDILNDISVHTSDIIYLTGDESIKSRKDLFKVNYTDLYNDLSIGDKILIDDGDIELVVKAKVDELLELEVLNDGLIKNNKSVNIPDVSISLPALSEKDRDFILFAIENDIDFIAHSFVRKKEDVKEVQDILDKQNSYIKIIAKIENQEGVDNIDEILDNVYGIMVARGDLAIEIPAERIPVIQKRIVNKCIESKKPVIIATQMLHSMIEHPRPTRAEVTDIANAVYNKTDAIMLSGETAYGKYPIEAVQTMVKVAREIEIENIADEDQNLVRINNEITAILARSAVHACKKIPVSAIITDTLTGRTARYVAAFRGNIPVYARCYRKNVMRELALSYGVDSDFVEKKESRDEFVKESLVSMVKKRYFTRQDHVLIIGGSFGRSQGATFMEISKVGLFTQMNI
jgi:pyruvate kinase